MKVVQIAESFAYGTAKSVKQLVGILKEDHDVTVFYGERDGTGLEQHGLDPSVRWIKLPGTGPLRHLTNLRFLLKQIPNESVVIHGHSSFGGAYAKALGVFRPNSRVLYSPRGYAFLRSDYRWIQRKLFWMFERLTAGLCQTVACGPSELSYAKGMSPKAMQIGNGWEIPTDVDTAQVGSGVVTVGRISMQKGFDLLLEMARKLPAVQFDWIGSEEQGQGQDSMRKNVPANVNIIDYMPHQEVLQKIRSARFVLLPSRWEGLSRFLVESVCLGKAIVTSECEANVDCLRKGDVGFQNGFKCGNTDEYIAAIQKLLKDDQIVREMQQASLAYARDSFDIETISQQWRDLYLPSDHSGSVPSNEEQALMA